MHLSKRSWSWRSIWRRILILIDWTVVSFQDVVTLTTCSWCRHGVEMASRPAGFRPVAVRRDTRVSSASNAQPVSGAGTPQTKPSAPVSPAAAEGAAATPRPETVTLLMRRPESWAALRGFTVTPGSLAPVWSVPVRMECPARWLPVHWSPDVTAVQPEPQVGLRIITSHTVQSPWCHMRLETSLIMIKFWHNSNDQMIWHL